MIQYECARVNHLTLGSAHVNPRTTALLICCSCGSCAMGKVIVPCHMMSEIQQSYRAQQNFEFQSCGTWICKVPSPKANTASAKLLKLQLWTLIIKYFCSPVITAVDAFTCTIDFIQRVYVPDSWTAVELFRNLSWGQKFSKCLQR